MCVYEREYIPMGVESIVCIKGKLDQLVSQTHQQRGSNCRAEGVFSKSGRAIAAHSTIAYEIIT